MSADYYCTYGSNSFLALSLIVEISEDFGFHVPWVGYLINSNPHLAQQHPRWRWEHIIDTLCVDMSDKFSSLTTSLHIV